MLWMCQSCPAQTNYSLSPTGHCYDELVAPLYSSSLGASSRYNIFYTPGFARLYSESCPPPWGWDPNL